MKLEAPISPHQAEGLQLPAFGVSVKKHPRRKPLTGLTPEEIVADMAKEAKNGKAVRNVRRPTERQEKSVLSQARSPDAGGGGKSRLFGPAQSDDAGRAGGAGQEEVSDPSVKGGFSQLSKILKRMLGETPPMDLLDVEGVEKAATNAELLGNVIFREAAAGKQWAVEMIRDQTEGKPVRAAQINNTDGEIEDMLDQVSAARLNQLVKGK